MGRKYALPVFAFVGFAIAVFVVLWGARKTPVPAIPFAPPIPPYKYFIAASGTIEAASDDISIGTPFNEVVTKMFVQVGDKVKKGDPLFQLDTRTFEAQYFEAKMESEQAKVQYASEKAQLDFYDSLTDKRAVSESDYTARYYAAESAKVAIAQAEAKMATAKTFIDRSLIQAPMDGKVLQINIHLGETANLNPFSNLSLMTFGPVSPLHVRVSIDEEEAWRYKGPAPAKAFIRGNSAISFPLSFVRIEPLVIPKQALTGSSNERVDTRVLQVIYAFEQGSLPVYAGQILDVFIEADKP